MKKFLTAALLGAFLAVPVCATDIREVFVNMPDSLLTLLSRNDRLDLIDYMDLGMDAVVTNRLAGPTMLKKLSSDRLVLQYTDMTEIQIKLFERQNSEPVICIVHTAGSSGLEDSRISFYDTSWNRLETSKLVKIPDFDDFIGKKDLRTDSVRTMRRRCEVQTVRIRTLEDRPEIVFTFTGTPFMGADAPQYLHFTHPVVRTWNSKRFR